MRYLIAILLPPLGMLLVGRAVQAIICLVMMCTLIGWPIASIWALLVVASAKADSRTNRIIEAMEKQNETAARLAAASKGQ